MLEYVQEHLRREHAVFIIRPHDENPHESWDVVLFLVFAHNDHKFFDVFNLNKEDIGN